VKDSLRDLYGRKCDPVRQVYVDKEYFSRVDSLNTVNLCHPNRLERTGINHSLRDQRVGGTGVPNRFELTDGRGDGPRLGIPTVRYAAVGYECV